MAYKGSVIPNWQELKQGGNALMGLFQQQPAQPQMPQQNMLMPGQQQQIPPGYYLDSNDGQLKPIPPMQHQNMPYPGGMR